MKRGLALYVSLFLLALPAVSIAQASPCADFFTRVTERSLAALPPRILVISAPSGAGKTTLIQLLVKKYPDLFAISVSTTTRAPRPGEVNGKDYLFTDQADFKKRIAAGDFVEWAEVFGNYYGTSKSQIAATLAQGKHVILNIDVSGAAKIREAYPHTAQTIFLQPPSLEVLEKRLRDRGTETEESLKKRLGRAESEMKRAPEFDSIVVNDKLDQAVEDLEAALLAH